MKLHEITYSRSRVVPCGREDGQMDMHDEANNHISKFCKRAKKFFILQSAFLCVVCTSKSTAIIFRVRQLTGL